MPIMNTNLLTNNAKLLFILIRRASSTATNVPSSVCPKEQNFFGNFSSSWWDDDASVKLLQAMTPLRVDLLQKNLIKAKVIDETTMDQSRPLHNLKILDIGCGGGFLSEAVAKQGAKVTGLDVNSDLINAAKEHMAYTPLLNNRLTYTLGAIEDFAQDNAEKFDVIISSEVIEHVLDKDVFAKYALQCLRPGGSAFITTINRTLFSGFYYIYLCENVFKFIPKGAHEFSKFMRPSEMAELFRRYNCITTNVDGFTLNPITRKWSTISPTCFNFALHATKFKSYY